MRRLIALAAVAVSLAACGDSPSADAPGDKLFEARSAGSGGAIDVIDSRAHRIERTLPLGAATPDWKHLYSIVSTSLVDTDPATGATLRVMPLGGAYRLPTVTAGGLPGGLSPNGAWLVVEAIDGSNMIVVDTTAWQMRRRFNLTGDFRFDAVSNTGDRLYLIQYVGGKEYFVRLYDVAAGVLVADPVVDKNEGGEAMTGERISGVPSVGGQWLYSMYIRDHSTPFIHALNLGGPYALCVDLPGGGYADDPQGARWTLAIDNRGEHLYATNAADGTIVQLDVRGDTGAAILRQGRLDPMPGAEGDQDAGASIVVGDTLIVAAGSGVAWIDTASLTVRHIALEDWTVTSLGASPDGKSVYAVSREGKIAQLSAASATVISTFEAGLQHPLSLLRVAAA
jgi:DNA-binding beta-propeller fold protein YncE